MGWSLLPALIVFTAVAFAVGASYLFLSWVANMMVGVLRRFRRSRPVSCRPGEVVHQALKITGRRWDQYRTAALLFCVSLALLLGFGQDGWWGDLSAGTCAVIGAVLLGMLGFGIVRMLQLMRFRVRLSCLLDAHIEVAKRLTEAQLRGNRVYHAVPIGGDIVDNIVVGSNGVYTVSLVMPPAQDCESVSFRRRGLVFQPGAVRYNLHQYRQTIVALTRALSERVSETVVVQPVIVVSDCRIEESQEDGPLLVSMESCTSFVGWKDQRAFLMEDDIATINDWLSRQVLEHQPRSLRQMANCLHGQVDRPTLA
jgi:hypothetical protein